MKAAEIKPGEKARLSELKSYSILDTLEEDDFDNLTSIAASICGTHISLVSLIDEDRQWFKSHYGLSTRETPRSVSFCAHALNKDDTFFEVPDARLDDRFHDNPLVTGHPHVIYYAGVKLINENGIPLGTLCVIDDKPNELNDNQIKSLKGLAKQVMNLLELRKSQMTLQLVVSQLKDTNESLEKFATIAAHDLKSPLNNILGITKILRETNEGIQTEECKENLEMIGLIEQSSIKLRKLIEGLLEYSKSDNLRDLERETIPFRSFVSEIVTLLTPNKNVSIAIFSSLETIYINRTILYHVLINLISNAIKYNDKSATKIEIKLSEYDEKYCLKVKDNGPGIPKEFHDVIFNLYTNYSSTDRFGQKGNGIGLSLIKRLINQSGGSILIESNHGEGATFTVLLNKE